MFVFFLSRCVFQGRQAQSIAAHGPQGATGTNGWEIQIAREGIATQILSIPLRYMHTPMEVVDLRDIEQGARLLAAFLRTLGEEGEKC